MGNDHFVQVPTPGDHYSFTTGSAIMTIIYELARKHCEAGGETTVIVGRGTRHDYGAGRCVETGLKGLPAGWKKAADVALGRAGFPRAMVNASYSPATDVVPRDFAGPIFLQNAPGPLRMFKKHAPNAQVILHAHNTLFKTYSDRELASVFAAADLAICNCEFLANEIRPRLAPEHAKKIRVFLNGVDTRRFVPNPQLRDSDVINVLFVARMVPEKGADLLIKAAAKIKTSRKFKVTVVGNQGFSAADPLSPYEMELRRLAEPLGEAVQFLPFIDRHGILPIYQAADIFCAPSNWNEPCTLTIPESMACGASVIASRKGGIPEMASDAVAYFDAPDTDELAERLTYLIEDDSARAAYGLKARARAESLDWSNRYRELRKVMAL